MLSGLQVEILEVENGYLIRNATDLNRGAFTVPQSWVAADVHDLLEVIKQLAKDVIKKREAKDQTWQKPNS